MSDEEPNEDVNNFNEGVLCSNEGSDGESDVDGVSETVSSDNTSPQQGNSKGSDKQISEDPFGFYELLDKHPSKGARAESPSLSHPPGFTPDGFEAHGNKGVVQGKVNVNGEEVEELTRVDANVMNMSQEVNDSINGESVSSIPGIVHNGGSIIGLLDDMVRVGHSMGYKLDGCLKDMERIIGAQGETDVLK